MTYTYTLRIEVDDGNYFGREYNIEDADYAAFYNNISDFFTECLTEEEIHKLQKIHKKIHEDDGDDNCEDNVIFKGTECCLHDYTSFNSDHCSEIEKEEDLKNTYTLS